MDILMGTIGFHKLFTARKMRKKAKFDLRIVSIYQYVSGAGHKDFSKLLPFLVSDGNILQIWVGAGKPPRRCIHLIVSRMNLPLGNQRLKSFHISGIELLYLPVTQQKADDFVILGILFEYLGRSAVIFLYFAFLCSAVAYL